MKNLDIYTPSKSEQFKREMRTLLIDFIFEYANDEYEDKNSLILLAKKTINELIEELDSILDYMKKNYTEDIFQEKRQKLEDDLQNLRKRIQF